MTKQRIFMRNVDGRDLLDAFFVSAVASIILVRFMLHIAGYPSLGGDKYHIGHMLWGGLLMLVAFVLNFAFLGRRLLRLVAVLGGVGFGVFIDEVGKFITRDNNYFFRPAVGIIYAVFVVLYLSISFLTRQQKLSSEEYQLNALRRFEEAIQHDMEPAERASARELLHLANQHDTVTADLLQTLQKLPVRSRRGPGRLLRWRQNIAQVYRRMWLARSSRLAVRAVFIAETLFFLVAVLGALYNNFDSVRDFFHTRADYGHRLVAGQLVSTLAAAGCMAVGLVQVGRSRLKALEWFRRSTLINLLLTEFFIFSRIEFGALPGFIFNLVLLLAITSALTMERDLQGTDSAASAGFSRFGPAHRPTSGRSAGSNRGRR